MRMRLKSPFFALLMTAGPALAQPSILPDRDVEVEYSARGMTAAPTGVPEQAIARFDARSGRVRVDPVDSQFYAIVDIAAGQMIMVMPEWRLYMVQPAGRDIMAMFRESRAALRRIGAEMVAGVPCLLYDAVVNDRTGQVCLTEDGVLLRARIEDPDRRRDLQAIRVTYAPQAAAYFRAPPGFVRVDANTLPPGVIQGFMGGGSRRRYPYGRSER